ncbi:hypothetical protein [Niallia oryzisoli]|uniref:hypothetical protein n=1 Tax=Niallia oryzisoli TaxID=1737571 RepID=UPI0037352982
MRITCRPLILMSALILITSFGIDTSKMTKAQTIERIPKKMEPWTIIEYVEDNKYEVIKKGTASLNETALPESEMKDRYLPLGKKGVVVEYGFNGRPNIVKGVEPGEEHPGRPELESQAIVQPDSLDGQIVKGMFSCYRGPRDERGFSLGEYDVAVNREIDNPPYGTTIFIKNIDNNKTLVVKKKDTGRLHPGVVLDLRTRAFAKLGGGNNCDGWIRNAAYIHY